MVSKCYTMLDRINTICFRNQQLLVCKAALLMNPSSYLYSFVDKVYDPYFFSLKSDFSPNLFAIKGLEKADEHIVFHASWG